MLRIEIKPHPLGTELHLHSKFLVLHCCIKYLSISESLLNTDNYGLYNLVISKEKLKNNHIVSCYLMNEIKALDQV